MTSLPHTITTAIADSISGRNGDPAFLTAIVTNRVQVKPDANGNPAIVILDASGNPETVWRDGRPAPATIDDLVKGLSENPTYAPAFGGGGNGGGRTSNPRVTCMSANDWLTKTSAATPEQRRVLFQEAAAGRYKIGN